MRKIFTYLFDGYLILSSSILLTGGSFLFTPGLRSLFDNRPKYHRLFLSAIMLTLIVLFITQHARHRLKTDSFIIRSIGKLSISNLQWVWILYALMASVFSVSSLMRHHVFTSSFDLAIFAQAVWNTWNGDFLFSSIKGGICLLGDHVSPILAVLAPLFGIWNDASVLLLLQAVVAASAVFPLFKIGQLVLKEDRLALFFVVAYALYLPLRNAVRFDFHPELLGDPLFLWAFYFVVAGREGLASFFLVVVLLTKETACAPIAMFGLYSWWVQKKARFGIAWFLIATVYFLISVRVVAPYFAHDDYFYLRGNYTVWQKIGWRGFLAHLFQPSTFTYLKKIFGPLGFLSFLSPPQLLLTFPILFQNLASRNPLTRSIFFQYTAFLTPFVFVSAIYGFRNFLRWAERQTLWPKTVLRQIGIYYLLSSALLLSGVSEWYVIERFIRQDNPHWAYVRRYLTTIPSAISVRTHEFFAPHLFNRKEVHIYENGHPKEGGSPRALSAEYVILDQKLLGDSYEEKIKELTDRNYRLKHEIDGFYVLERQKG